MRWVVKAALMAACDAMPGGSRFYRLLQLRFGNARSSAMRRAPYAIRLWDLVRSAGVDPCDFLEVGTGHKPIVPLVLFLLGAQRVRTVDLHRRLDWGSTAAAMRELAHDPDVKELIGNRVNRDLLERRLQQLVEASKEPMLGLENLGIVYMAPHDAARTGLADGSIQCHFSVTTLEHIEPSALVSVMCEAKRLIGDRGVSVHFVDPSDHFSHGDESMLGVNHLRFSERAWNLIAGNQFAYCNRLILPEYTSLFHACGLVVQDTGWQVDRRSADALAAGFVVDAKFASYPVEQLAAVNLRFLLRSEAWAATHGSGKLD